MQPASRSTSFARAPSVRRASLFSRVQTGKSFIFAVRSLDGTVVCSVIWPRAAAARDRDRDRASLRERSRTFERSLDAARARTHRNVHAYARSRGFWR
jgi:hypothetical protein